MADLTALPYHAATFDGATSVDVLFLVSPNSLLALREVARILKPGARFVFTDWERDIAPPGYPPPGGDYRHLLRAAGFELETYEDVPNAEPKRRGIYERYIARNAALERELGEDIVKMLVFEARSSLGLEDGTDYLAKSRRLFAEARKR